MIVGENGAGKSSIFEAISFALFKSYTTKSINDLVRSNKNTGDKIQMVVKLSFVSNGTEYMVERTITLTKSGSKPTSNLYKIVDGEEEIYVSGNKEVDKEIEVILSMDSSTFLNAIHIRQGEIAELIDKTPAKRKKLIGKLLRLEELEKAYDNLPKISEDYKTRKAVLEDRIQPESELNFELKKAKEEHFTLNEKNNALKKDHEALKSDIELKNKEKEELDKQKQEYETLKLKLVHENENLNGLNKLKEDLSNKFNEILRNESEMNLLKPDVEKLPIYTEFKGSLSNLNKLKDDEKGNKDTITKIEGYKSIIESEQENHERFVSLEGETKALNNKKVELSAELKRLDELEKEKNTLIRDIDQYNNDLETFYNDAKTVLSEFEEEINPIKTNDDLNSLESLVENLRTNIKKEIDEIDEELKKLNKESISLNQEIKSLEEPLSDIKEVDNKCPVCQSDISEDKKNELIHMYEETINTNTKKIGENNEIITKLNKDKSLKDANLLKLDSIKTKIYQNKHIVGDLDKFTNKKYLEANTLLKSSPDESKIKDELYTISGKINLEEEKLKEYIASDSNLSLDMSDETLDDLIKDLSKKDTRYHVLMGSVKSKEEYEKKLNLKSEEIAQKENDINVIKKAIESSPYNEENYRNMIFLIDRLNDKFNGYTKEIAVNDNNLKIYETTVETIEKTIETNRKNKEEFIAVKEYYGLLEDLRTFYSKDGIQKDLRSQSRPLIQKYTREFFEKFNFNYSDLILDDEYNISIYGPEGESNIEMVSGGEKIAIALALRLGITQAMSKGNIETILLDEPTIHLDTIRKQHLITVLRSMSVIPQMLIVTHDDELENAADTLIRVVKEDGISTVKINS